MLNFFSKALNFLGMTLVYSYEGLIMFFLERIYLTVDGRESIIRILEARANVRQTNSETERSESNSAKSGPQLFDSDFHDAIN